MGNTLTIVVGALSSIAAIGLVSPFIRGEAAESARSERLLVTALATLQGGFGGVVIGAVVFGIAWVLFAAFDRTLGFGHILIISLPMLAVATAAKVEPVGIMRKIAFVLVTVMTVTQVVLFKMTSREFVWW